jgi:serine/threonine protein kinase
LILEYLPFGNLEDQHHQRSISDDEAMTILHQSLLALTYLHGQTPSIAHRDIKPQNILVQSRDPLYIKLADFGLSKASDYLSTLCGTHSYLAPEIAQYYGSNCPHGVKYVNAVDIWSLGVVIFEYAYGLPHPGSGAGLPWCGEIISALHDWDSDELIALLSSMIVMDPKLREPAWKCLDRASQLRVPGRSLTPTPAYCSLQRGHTEVEDGFTTIILGNLWGTQGTSYHDNSEICSTYPAGIKRQRSPAAGSTNTFSNRGRTKRRRPQTHHSNNVSERYAEPDRFDELYNAILKLFVDLEVDASHDLDERTCALIEELCENFCRLNITRVRLTKDNILDQTIVFAGREGDEFMLATLTPSEVICPPAELAAHLLNMLEFQGLQRRSRAKQSESPLDDTTIHTGFRTQELNWTADSTGSQITSSNVQELGVTYPSALLDVCNVSGTRPYS